MSDIILRTEKLCKSFSTGGNQQHVLKNIDLEIRKGDFTIIMGSSGSGKSTLLYALSGMDRPSLGKVEFQKRDISKCTNDELAVFRRDNCGFVFQSIYLLDNMSALDNVLTSALLKRKSKKEVLEETKQLLKKVGIDENSWNKFPSQMSGGECQRVGIVRALINHPRIVFADEPTGALNSASGQAVLNILTEVNREGQSLVVVTHDIKTAMRGNRILYIKDGNIRGELNLPFYEEQETEKRRKEVQLFLEQMGW
ncbi:MAG: ABC transporter ATP-binding protein [Clostridiales bacterium]|nr:ABC transporter ATP-binding protein [Clostridiales bacterium]